MYRILNLLKEQTFVTVKQLMDEFDVSSHRL
ncbi:MAG: DeoR family transcriptional regulator [Longibaculum sp.]